MEGLKGKTAVITGGTKGIGYGIAEALLAVGMNVAITGRDREGVDRAVTDLTHTAPTILGLVSDVKDYDSQERAIATIMEKWGRLDVVIANAGVGHFAPIQDLTPEQWHDTIDTNLTGVFYTLRACLDALTKSKGYFMTISSLAGTNFFANGSAYNASKFGLTGFTQAAMLDLRSLGIKTTTIMPGSVATFFNNHIPDAADAWKIQREDIGQMVVDLLKMPSRTLPSKIEVRPSFPG